ncbi:polysaccharide deacetylase family protein [Xanthomonas sp. NCPPB 2654]|uniref:polysaccharide deacetylase family protein n=1 Tax=unclassified Xanthomonas TaxID=2643310 RepID=UPI0021E0E3FC|nr:MULTISPECIES: polysaccharide deacetylase family protein [unclassified Xanthomonas]MDL5366764.1 polysaccharide deacetylase family protein [Xanthomonas sp. NCPPB 2654]UYC19734.1 polysaccharide deacetylase family protein [Xanthomonas sp. CFBP 8443]
MHPAPSAAAARIPIFMYHNIAQAPPQLQVYRSLYVAPARFARQMRLLRRLGYRGVSMSEAAPYLRGERRGRIAVVTLDDGYADNLHAALPVLQRLGFSATVYAVSGSIGRHNDWDAQKLGIEKPLMTLAELRQWRSAGMEIGAHTRSHPRLTACSDAALREEIGGCKRELEDLLGEPVAQFCYPYGDVDARVAAAVREAGYVAATSTRRGRAVPGSDPWRYPRIQVARHHLLPQFALRALTGYEDRRA